MKTTINILAVCVVLAALIFLTFNTYSEVTTQAVLNLGSINNQKCSVSSTEVAVVGGQVSTTILSANETRAYASIQNRFNATNTISLSFDEGAAAVANEGHLLYATTSQQKVEFGRATNFPYTGAVTGIASVGSSTVVVTECSY